MPQFFTFDHDEVLAFDGYFDPLYGVVAPYEKSFRLPRQLFRYETEVWNTYDEALTALKDDSEAEFNRAVARRRNVIEKDLQRRERMERLAYLAGQSA
jgi:hypothetical protein